jgi:beta-glucanase (GH16 family)
MRVLRSQLGGPTVMAAGGSVDRAVMAVNRIPLLGLIGFVLFCAATIALPSDVEAAEPNCGDASVLPGPGGSWECTFGDGFDGGILDQTKWIAQRTETSGFTNGKTACFIDSPNNISVSGGSLKLTARKESEQFTCTDPNGNFDTQYTSGMVSTAEGRFGQAFGRFEVRAKVSSAAVKGLHSAFWLWPVDPTKYGSTHPASGEIDIAELYSEYPDRAIPYIHYIHPNHPTPDPTATNNQCLISDPDEFHTYAVEWTRSSIEIIYDGWTCLFHTLNPAPPLQSPQPFDQPFIVSLTQALGVGTNAFDPATTPLPATTEVDYVRVWQWRPAPPASPQPLPASPQTAPKAQRACKAAKRAKTKRARRVAKSKCRRQRG